jgi:hypothetical protein
MKGLTKDKIERNPNEYNGEVLKSHQSSHHSKSLLSTDNQRVTNNKKVFIEC